MKSRTSFFDRAVFTRALKTAAIPMALYTLLLIFLLPATLPNALTNTYNMESLGARLTLLRTIYNSCKASGILTFFYGLILAWLLYFFLFRTNTAYRYAAMPVRREALFGTNFLTGVLAFVVPHALIALAALIVTAALGEPLPLACAQWFAVISCECLFFFSFAALLVMVVGQMAAMPVVYVILNCAVAVLYAIVTELLQGFVYGMPDISDSPAIFAMYLSPLAALLTGVGPRALSVYSEAAADPVDFMLAGAWYACALAAVGVLFAALALLLYKKREMERCGDVVAVRQLKPVFLYAFTFGCAFVIGGVIIDAINLDFSQSNLWPVLLFLGIGAFIGYFGAQMMLKKIVRVFRKGWLGFGICCAVLLVGFGAMRLDVTGYERRIPDAQDVAAVSIGVGSYAFAYETRDEDAIEDVIALHETILAQRDEQQALRRSDVPRSSRYISVSYRLKNDKTLRRVYPLVDDAADPENPLRQFAALYNSLPFVLARSTPDMELTPTSVATCEIYGVEKDGAESKFMNLSSEDAYTFYHDCVLPDLADSSMERLDFGLDDASELPAAESAELTVDEPIPATQVYVHCDINFTFRNPDGTTRGGTFLSITKDAARCIAYLDSLGFNTDFTD